MAGSSELTEFYVDLTAHEGEQLAAVLAASPGWDPIVALADETRAYEMLYANLDAEQQAVYDQLAAAGVLDDRR